ncbi:hypothetical protein [Mangrovimonas cancribranchiae]|uniref:Lipoprotein n=1 Tax=Mangrovimonas cancribranchiae TaxID=3080055 RepID=A0AAU6P6V2_9FLAO
MKTKKDKIEIVCNVIFYILVATVVAIFFMVSSCATTQTANQTTTVAKDSFSVKTDSVKTNKVETKNETLYKGFKEAFNIYPDTLTNKLPEYKRRFNNGAVSGEVGYSKKRGAYYDIETKDLKETDHKIETDTTKTSKQDTKSKTFIDTVSETVLVTKKWGRFQWITFIISLAVVVYIVYRVYKFINGGFLSKIAKKITT